MSFKTIYYEPILKKIYSSNDTNPHNTIYIGGTFYSSEEEIIQDTINKITNNEIEYWYKGILINSDVLEALKKIND